MKAEIISVGDELLIGQTVNTNATFIARGLTKIGIEVVVVTTIGDKAKALTEALATSLARVDVVVMTGGLGPTHDDITKKVVTDYFGATLQMDSAVFEQLKERFNKRGIKISKLNEDQALVPDKARVLPNPLGTAPGLIFEEQNKLCFILPGVPYEMEEMCEQTLFPMLLKKSGRVNLQKTIRTTNISESALFEKIGDIEQVEQFAKVAFLPKAAGVDIQLKVSGDNAADCHNRLQKGLNLVEDKIFKYIYAYDEQPLEEVVADLLLKKKKTLATAESCTGGTLANRLTNVSGSSGFFERGIIAYSNKAKMELLAVPEGLINKHGAVSAETAEAMAFGIRKMANADFGLSTTGIAGPTGGSKEKPVGLVYVGIATKTHVKSRRFIFSGVRLINKDRAAQRALALLREMIEA